MRNIHILEAKSQHNAACYKINYLYPQQSPLPFLDLSPSFKVLTKFNTPMKIILYNVPTNNNGVFFSH